MSSTSNRASGSRSNSVRSRHTARVAAQTSMDARLHQEFEDSSDRFHYSSAVDAGGSTSGTAVPSATVSAFLQKMQRGKLIQPFGCMIAVEEDTFAVIAYSENAPEMLDLAPHAVPSIEQQEVLTVGVDARSLFRPLSASSLQKAASYAEVSLLNPILVHCRNSGKPFYAILHRIDVGLVIDLEPVNPADVPVTAAGALKSYKLAAKAITRLQSLPSGSIALMCDVLVREVSDLTGYDRVMAYKFHEDEHGEVIAECKRSDLEPYLGLHYPATDIPQASRFLFMKNKVRMICDCTAPPVKVIQDRRLAQPLSLAGSTLRAPHGCHSQYMSNMGSIASLVMSVMVSEGDEDSSEERTARKLWGLVVCHHASPRFIPFPLRYACEFLIQVFAIQLSKEVELAAQMKEKHVLRMQTVLCDMLLRDAPMGIMTQSPNVMDLVKCDGAALYYRGQCWFLGTTPTEKKIRDITEWLHQYHGDSTGLSTDSLVEAGYPGAHELGDEVCGMAAITITKRDFLFWFRSHTAKEIKWGGERHDPKNKEASTSTMNPRTSFKTFLEVVKRRSVPWEDVEMDAIHSLQLILRDSLQEEIALDKRLIAKPAVVDTSIQRMDELRLVTNEMVRLIETAHVPIFAVDASGNINGWNNKAAEVTGLSVERALGTPLIELVVEELEEIVQNMLRSALDGTEEQNVEIKLKTFGEKEHIGPVILVVNACCSRDVQDNLVGVCFIAQDLTGEKMVLDKYTRIQGDYNAIVTSPNVLIPPIFIINEAGSCVEWNLAMQNLSGLKRSEAIDKIVIGELFSLNNFGCQVKDHDTLTRLKIVLNEVVAGQEADKLLFGFFNRSGKLIEALLSATKRTDSEGKITGVFCFLHVASPELQHALKLQNISEQAAKNGLRELSYIRHEIRNPLSGMTFTRDMIKQLSLNHEQKQLLKTSALCQEQLEKVLDDIDLESIEECYLDMNTLEFNLGEVLEAVKVQAMDAATEKEVQLEFNLRKDVSSMFLYGDNLRLQQVLSDFLVSTVKFSPAGGSVMVSVAPRMERIGDSMHIVHLEFRITHPIPGAPETLLQEMFHHSRSVSREGLNLYISQKLVKIMNGSVQYLREADKSSFIILLEFPVVDKRQKSNSLT